MPTSSQDIHQKELKQKLYSRQKTVQRNCPFFLKQKCEAAQRTKWFQILFGKRGKDILSEVWQKRFVIRPV